MYDILPFPNIVGSTKEEQIGQIINYLIQFKEELEFVLANITVDNLSPSLMNVLNSLGADIKKDTKVREEQVQQIAGKIVTVTDVVGSSAFDTALTNKVNNLLEDITLTVNYETGNLEYELKGE